MPKPSAHCLIDPYLLRGDYAGGLAFFAHARDLARARSDRRAEADAELGLAICAQQGGASDEGMVAAVRAIAIYSELKVPAGEAECRALLSRFLIANGDTDEALQEGLRAQTLAEHSADPWAQHAVMLALTNLYLVLAQWEPAVAHGERAAELARLLADDLREGRALDTLGCVWGGMAEAARQRGEAEQALRCDAESARLSGQAVAIARRCKNRRLEGTALANLAESLALLGRLDEAQALLAAWPVDPEHDTAFTVTHHLDTWGLLCLRLGRHEEAVSLFRRGLAIAENQSFAMQLNEHLADALERSGDMAAALFHFKRFHELSVQVSSEAAQRAARVAAVKLETAAALARAEVLSQANEQLSRRADDLVKLSLEDPLTGLPNRRALDEALGVGERGWALALIDVDHFKRVNDLHSHLVGDEVLRHLARLLRACCRGSDLPVRWGGEEFAILLRQLADGAAAAAAERVRAAIEAYDWASVATGLTITVSIGVAAGSAAQAIDQVLADADQRLYAAKRAGRNRVVA